MIVGLYVSSTWLAGCFAKLPNSQNIIIIQERFLHRVFGHGKHHQSTTDISNCQRAPSLGSRIQSSSPFSMLPTCSPLASALSVLFVTKPETALFYLILGSAAIQVVGVGLTSSLPRSQDSIPHAQYGYEVITGFWFEFGLTKALREVTK